MSIASDRSIVMSPKLDDIPEEQGSSITPEPSPQNENLIRRTSHLHDNSRDDLFVSPSESAYDSDESNRSGSKVVRPRSNLMYEKLVRPLSEAGPMRLRERLVSRFKRWFGKEEDTKGKSQQYRIPPREEKSKNSLEGIFDLMTERNLEKLTHYYFRTSFTVVICFFLLFYFLCIWLFSFFIHLVLLSYDARGRECLDGWETFQSSYEISFSLSWTTFSTVGFGTVSPPNIPGCNGLRYLLAIEAFFGVLYAGFCGAIWYQKIARIHHRARVTFSSAMCLQFGAGVTETPLDVRSSVRLEDEVPGDNSDDEEVLTQKYPVIEMRLVNDRAGFDGGEIIDATIRCMVSRIRLKDDAPSDRFSMVQGLHLTHRADTFCMRRVVSEDSRSRIPVKKRIYQNLKVFPNNHPYFRSAWHFRHTLDDHSPLLKPSVRRRIAALGGFPVEMNDYESIKNCLLDSLSSYEVLIIFNGTSNLTADNVFKTHQYRMEDMFVGWQFAKMSFLPEKKPQEDEAYQALELDMSLIHDILPQNGGGEEPIGSRADDRKFFDIPRFGDDDSQSR